MVSLPAPIGSQSIITATVPRYFIALLPKVAPQESVSPTRLDFPPIFFPSPPKKPAARGKALFYLSFWPAYIHIHSLTRSASPQALDYFPYWTGIWTQLIPDLTSRNY